MKVLAWIVLIWSALGVIGSMMYGIYTTVDLMALVFAGLSIALAAGVISQKKPQDA